MRHGSSVQTRDTVRWDGLVEPVETCEFMAVWNVMEGWPSAIGEQSRSPCLSCKYPCVQVDRVSVLRFKRLRGHRPVAANWMKEEQRSCRKDFDKGKNYTNIL